MVYIPVSAEQVQQQVLRFHWRCSGPVGAQLLNVSPWPAEKSPPKRSLLEHSAPKMTKNCLGALGWQSCRPVRKVIMKKHPSLVACRSTMQSAVCRDFSHGPSWSTVESRAASGARWTASGLVVVKTLWTCLTWTRIPISCLAWPLPNTPLHMWPCGPQDWSPIEGARPPESLHEAGEHLLSWAQQNSVLTTGAKDLGL